MDRTILVATDGSSAAAGALRLARAVAERQGAKVEVLTVFEPLPLYGVSTTDVVAYTRREAEDSARETFLGQVAAQLKTLGAPIADWSLTLELGAPAPTIARASARRNSSLIILGLGRHTLSDRLFGSETALRVMRLAHVPVLAAEAGARELPRRVVVATDFTDFSLDAARMAAELVVPGTRVHLAHVLRMPADTAEWMGGREWVEVARKRAVQQLHATVEELPARGVEVETHILEGDPAREVLHLAGEVGAELIAAGSHGAGFIGRILMGSVSTRLVRGATCSVLIAPPRTVPEELQETAAGAEEERGEDG